MITPNKFISFNESVLSKLKFILDVNESMPISDLYLLLADRFDDIDQFLYALDVLYVLDKININNKAELIINAEGN